MEAAKAIETIFKVLEAEFGKPKATESTSVIMSLIIYRLTDEGKEVNVQNITDELSVIANDYLEVTKFKVA